MSQTRCEKKGVSAPDSTLAKRRVNENLLNLLKIKEEMNNEDNSDTFSGNELSFEYTQPIRPQQFYSDLDTKLDGLNKDDYVKELLKYATLILVN